MREPTADSVLPGMLRRSRTHLPGFPTAGARELGAYPVPTPSPSATGQGCSLNNKSRACVKGHLSGETGRLEQGSAKAPELGAKAANASQHPLGNE